ncbi:MAG: uroporphyrinogen decarboxylase family protein [Mangrovibacterium sp.]
MMLRRNSIMHFEKIFPEDCISKRERIELTLDHKPIDRVAILEQLSYNPDVISMSTGKSFEGFNYTLDDICEAARRTTDMIMPPVLPKGTGTFSNIDGFVFQNDNWNSWHVSRPFNDEAGARDWLIKRTNRIKTVKCDPDYAMLPGIDSSKCKAEISTELLHRWYHDYMCSLQQKIGDTVILNYSQTGFCSVFDSMGLEIFTFFYIYYPEVMHEFMEVSTEVEIRRVHAVADSGLSPVILIPEDFSHKGGPIFSPDMLETFHYPYLKKLTSAWHEHGVKVLYHSDGNYKPALSQLMKCGVDGFYCLEKNAGMDVVELKRDYPEYTWAGGVDGVELLERGTPKEVTGEVCRHITETDVLNTGGMIVASSSEINPPVREENFMAMVNACNMIRNPVFKHE